MKTLKQFSGNSQSIVELIEVDGKLRVRKTNDIERNIQQLTLLSSKKVNVPKILYIENDFFDMEYIPHMDIKGLLVSGNQEQVADFLLRTIQHFSASSTKKDYTDTFEVKLSEFPWRTFNLPFEKRELIQKLPKILPNSLYHGDFTLENMILGRDGVFYLLDPLTSPYDSFVFDLAKLRQDISCKWFIRNDNLNIDSKLRFIDSKLSNIEFYSDDAILILMLMRILPYTKTQKDKTFIEMEIAKLWKL